jgi:FixJ family two-component response regulator
LPPIIVMSSHPDVAIFTRTMGATAFLHKPARAEDVIELVGPLLEQSTGTVEAGLAAREFSG